MLRGACYLSSQLAKANADAKAISGPKEGGSGKSAWERSAHPRSVRISGLVVNKEMLWACVGRHVGRHRLCRGTEISVEIRLWDANALGQECVGTNPVPAVSTEAVLPHCPGYLFVLSGGTGCFIVLLIVVTGLQRLRCTASSTSCHACTQAGRSICQATAAVKAAAVDTTEAGKVQHDEAGGLHAVQQDVSG